MTAKSACDFTLKRLFFGDMVLNWALGAVLTLAPAWVDQWLGYSPLLPALIYRVIGLVFLAFAGWQTVIVARRRLGPAALFFAAFMALGPVILLTVALVWMDFALYRGARVVLWAGNVYMFLLGVWYTFVGLWLLRQPSAETA
jgi:hypothetical protein